MSWLEGVNSQLIFSVLVTCILLVLLRMLAPKIGLVDHPNQRKIHDRMIPLVGGLSVFSTLTLNYFVFGLSHQFLEILIMVSALVLLVGIIDDIRGLKPWMRFAAQILACLLLIYYSGVKIHSFGQLLWPGWDLTLGILSVPITVFGVVGIINALNMTDGIDGLAAMTFVIPLMTIAYLQNDPSTFVWLVSMCLSVLAFVMFNFSERVKVFLGDHGSLLLGFILSWILVNQSQKPVNNILPVTALYLVAPALFDTIFVMVRRIKRGISPFKADNTHVHHLLLAAGLSQLHALVILSFTILIFVSLGLVLMFYRVSESFQFYLFVFMSGIYYLTLSYFWKKVQR